MFYQLPPVGNPVQLRGGGLPLSVLDAVVAPCKPHFFASGTAALAAAIIAATRHRPVADPEIILPAYGCPDLVSAAVHAGVKPVLVDLESGRPWLDFVQLQQRVGASTVAIIAVDLLGMPERFATLRRLAHDAGALLIEDSAQFFPGDDEPDAWQGDLVVLSFGRGKPVSLLGGGAVLSREASIGECLPRCTGLPQNGMPRRAGFRLKAALYNRMILPRLYWLPQLLPFLQLGETSYHALDEIACMDAHRLALLGANIADYRGDPMHAQTAIAGMLSEIDAASRGLVDLPAVCGVSPRRRLLRYPLLVDTDRRERLYHALRKQGLGPSLMYPSALPGIEGMASLLAGQGPFPAAEQFAGRMLTLPTHRGAGLRDIERMRRLL